MIASFKDTLRRHHLNYKGWKSPRKYVVIESDDWGSIRMPSGKVYDELLKQGIPVDKNPYCKYDSLASEQDLIELFDVLSGFKDYQGNSPVFTANSLVANPDFQKIRETGFKEYSFEKITETFKRYRNHERCYELWKEGISENIFVPQFHGREHLNVPYWMKLLRNEHPVVRLAFDLECWGINYKKIDDIAKSLQANYDVSENNEFKIIETATVEGLKLFKDLFGFGSESFIAGNYIWSPAIHETLYNQDVRYIQGMKYQLLPKSDYRSKRKKIRHIVGEKNKLSQIYLVRNCLFEPSLYPNQMDPVGHCLKDIQNAFLWKKPAIIATHRLNYIGNIIPENRKKNLILLRNLLKKILEIWPEVEFVTSNCLGRIIRK